MVDLKIENVITELNFAIDLDLQKIADSIENADYNPEQFPGIVYKLKSPKTVTLMFSRGYSVCTGATSLQNARAALTIIYKKLKDMGLISTDTVPKITIQNIIVSYQYDKPLDIVSLAKKLPSDEVEYNPAQFPGLVYKNKAMGISVLLFNSGVIVAYGTPLIDELDNLLTELEQYYT